MNILFQLSALIFASGAASLTLHDVFAKNNYEPLAHFVTVDKGHQHFKLVPLTSAINVTIIDGSDAQLAFNNDIIDTNGATIEQALCDTPGALKFSDTEGAEWCASNNPRYSRYAKRYSTKWIRFADGSSKDQGYEHSIKFQQLVSALNGNDNSDPTILTNNDSTETDELIHLFPDGYASLKGGYQPSLQYKCVDSLAVAMNSPVGIPETPVCMSIASYNTGQKGWNWAIGVDALSVQQQNCNKYTVSAVQYCACNLDE